MSITLITDSEDAIVRVTSAAICGSDLHLYHEEFSGMR
jgi:threonine dehydrogenase-like Zn-dependent dehydrogenase